MLIHIAARLLHLFAYCTVSLVKQISAWFISFPPSILSDIYSGILAWNLPRILSGIHSGILSDIYSDILSGIQSIWHIFWHILTFYLTFYVAFFLAFYLAFFGIWHIFWHLSWGPAMPTGLGRSPVDVQRCPLDSRGPRLRSSSGHCHQELARRRGGEEARRRGGEEARRRGGEEARRRGGEEARRRRRRRRRKVRRAILKSNNPRLAGGEKWEFCCKTHDSQPSSNTSGTAMSKAI